MLIEKYVILSERGQVVIPKKMRDQEQLEPDARLKLTNIDGTITIQIERKNHEPEDRIFELLKKAKFTEKDWQKNLLERE